jgi:hypothetical protein
MIDLTVRLREDPNSGEQVFRLVSVDGTNAPGSNLPDPQAALAALRQAGAQIFFPAPGPPRLCTQQYGGPQVAVVTGTFHDRQVDCRFSRTDGCEISRWNALAPLLGGGTTS